MEKIRQIISWFVKAMKENKLFFCIVVALIGLLLFFTKMNALPMENYDEGVYSQATLEMSRSNDYWTLSYQGVPFYEKPPLNIWASLPLVKLFGPENWTFRFWSAFAGIGSAIILGMFVYEKERRMLTAWFSSLIFITAEFTILHAFRSGDTDGFLMFFSIIGMYAYWKGLSKGKWFLVAGAAFALAVMSKSVAGLVGPVIVIAESIISGRWNLYRERWLWLGLGVFTIVVAPWHLAQTVMHGGAFWKSYIGYHVIDRSTAAIFPFKLPYYWYIEVIGNRLFPFSFLLPFAGIYALWSYIKGQKKLVLILLWAIIPFLGYSIAITKFEQYILLCYPACIWIISEFLVWIKDVLQKKKEIAAIALVFCSLLGVLFCGIRNLQTINAKKAVSPYQRVAEFVAKTDASSVIIYDTDYYIKPAGYFELSKLKDTMQIISAKSPSSVMDRMNSGSVLIFSDETDVSAFEGIKKISTVDHYTLYSAESR